MSNNIFDIESIRPIERLSSTLGLPECKRLGFIFEDDDGIMSLSSAGLGYLLFVEAAGVTGLAESFAAGYQCAKDES